MELRRSLVVACSMGIALATVAIPPTEARASSDSDYSYVSISGGGRNRVYTSERYTISADRTDEGEQELLEVHIGDGVSGSSEASFRFTSVKGSKRPLDVGYYGDAQSYVDEPGRPMFSIGMVDFCGDQTGNFEVHEIRREYQHVRSLWITFVRNCYGKEPLFGEIRIGGPDSSPRVYPEKIRWPQSFSYPGLDSYDVPVRIRDASARPAEVRTVTTVGAHAADFPIRRNDCTGALTTTGCDVTVGFNPRAPGPRHAWLKIGTTGGDRYVSLDGVGALGRSEWVLDVDHGSITWPDEHLVMPYAPATGNPYVIQLQGIDDKNSVWRLTMRLPAGQRFAPGRYAFSSDGSGLQISLSRSSSGYEFERAVVDITDIAFSGPDEELSLLDMTLDVVDSSNNEDKITGRITFHDRDDLTPPAPPTGIEPLRAADNVTLRWRDPKEADVAGVLVRWFPGNRPPEATDAGHAAHIGTGESVHFSTFDGSPVAASVWTYDTSGNVSEPVTLVLPPHH